MAEVIGVAASVAGLITIADLIVRTGYKYINSVKGAEKSIKRLIQEVNNLSGVLHSLKNLIQHLEENQARHDPTIQIHCVESCYQTLSKIQEHLNEAIPSTPNSTFDKLKWPISGSRAKELLTEIERHKSTMSLAIGAEEMSTLLKILEVQDSIKGRLQEVGSSIEFAQTQRSEMIINEERKKMMGFLGSIDPRKWQDSNIRLRQPGTGVWFIECAEFKSWLSIDQSKLWIYGIPGAGKTILVSTIIQELERSLSSADGLCFFYCDYKDTTTHEIVNILGALAKQLVLQNESCFALLNEFFQTHFVKDCLPRQASAHELCDFIIKLTTCFGSTTIIIDGLDEISENRSDTTELLRSLSDRSKSIKILLSSRPEVDISYHLQDFVPISIAARSSDLRLYVASEIEHRTKRNKLRIRDPNLIEHIMKTLVEGAEGMFRWVSCQLDYLCECNNDRDRRQALKKLPPDLPSSYERILERANKSSKENQELVVRTLQWIMHAEEPLRTEQLVQALAVHDSDSCFDPTAMTTEEDILYWCSSLVRVNESSKLLEVAHFTVKEFLLSIDIVGEPWFLQYQISDDHTLLAKTCLTFLSFQSFGELEIPDMETLNKNNENRKLLEFWDNYLDQFPFITYASRLWDFHTHSSDWETIEQRIFDLLSPIANNRFLFWSFARVESTAYENITYDIVSTPLRPTALHWAACLALDKVCDRLIQAGMNVNEPSIFGTPLNCAIIADCAPERWLDDLETVKDNTSWHETARMNVMRSLIRAGSRFDHNLDPDSNKSPSDMALEIESFIEEPTMLHILFEAGATLSKSALDWTYQCLFGGEYNPNEGLSSTLHTIIKHVSKSIGRNLQPHCRLQFFKLMLDLLCAGCSTDELISFFSFDFRELLQTSTGQELNGILEDDSSGRETRIFTVLSRVICDISESEEDAKDIFDEALRLAISAHQGQAISYLLTVNKAIDPSRQDQSNEYHPRIRSPSTKGNTLLHHAVIVDASPEIFESLLHQGIETTIPNNEGRTVMHLAAEACSADIFRLLWEKFSSSNATEHRNEMGYHSDTSYVELAVNQPSVSTLELLVEQNLNLDDANADGQTVLHMASDRDGSLAAFKFIVDKGADASIQNGDGNAVIHVLSQNNDDLSAEKLQYLLLRSLPDLTQMNRDNFTLLALAAAFNNSKAVELLLDSGANIDFQQTSGQFTALHCAASFGSEKAVRELLDRGPDLDVRSKDGSTALILAASRSHWDVASILLKYGANPEIQCSSGECFLHFAARIWPHATVDSLLADREWLSVDIQNQQGITPLHLSARFGNLNLFKLLIKKGASLDLRSLAGGISHFAVQTAISSVRQELLKYDINWNIEASLQLCSINVANATSLHVAAALGIDDSICFLLDNNLADVDTLAEDGITPLHLAAMANAMSCVSVLLKSGADVGLVNTATGETALHLAAKLGYSELAKVLVEHGSNALSEDYDKKTPKCLALSRNFLDTAHIIQSAADRQLYCNMTGLLGSVKEICPACCQHIPGNLKRPPRLGGEAARIETEASLPVTLPNRSRSDALPGLETLGVGTEPNVSKISNAASQNSTHKISQTSFSASSVPSAPSFISHTPDLAPTYTIQPQLFKLTAIASGEAHKICNNVGSLVESRGISTHEGGGAETLYMAWHFNYQRSLEDSALWPFVILNEDSRPVLQGMLKGVFKKSIN